MRNEQLGFTIIEILVVFSLVAFLSGIGIISFVTYSRSQELSQSASNIKLFVQEAKFNALSSVKSVNSGENTSIDCGTESLTGYSVEIFQAAKELRMFMLCANASSQLVKTFKLPENLSFTASTTCSEVQFEVVSANPTGLPCDIQFVGYGSQKTVAVDRIGNVSIQ